jgi:hypothetical protein
MLGLLVWMYDCAMLTGPARTAHIDAEHYLYVIRDVEMMWHILMAAPHRRLPAQDYTTDDEQRAQREAYSQFDEYLKATDDPVKLPPFENLKWTDSAVPIWADHHFATIQRKASKA